LKKETLCQLQEFVFQNRENRELNRITKVIDNAVVEFIKNYNASIQANNAGIPVNNASIQANNASIQVNNASMPANNASMPKIKFNLNNNL
jgi:hypothetical protein